MSQFTREYHQNLKSLHDKIPYGESMEEITITVKVPKELEEKIKEEILRMKAKVNVREALKRARGSLKTEKSWQELEAEVYDELVP